MLRNLGCSLKSKTMDTSDSKKTATYLQSGERISKPVGKNIQRPSELQGSSESSSTVPTRPSELQRPTESSSTRPARPSEVQRPRPATRPSTSVRPSSDSSSTPTVTKVVVKTDPKEKTEIVKISRNFSIYGNQNGATVINEKQRAGLGNGDGNIGDGEDGTKIIQVTAIPNTVAYNTKTGKATVDVTIRLDVWEYLSPPKCV